MRTTAHGWSAGALTALLVLGGTAHAAPKTATFDVTAVSSAPGGQVTITSKVWLTPTQARADVKHPLQGNHRVLVSKGLLYQLDPDSKRGVKGPLPPEFKKSGDNFTALFSMFAFDAASAIKQSQKVRTETVAGFPCDVYSKSVTKDQASRSITIWVPKNTQPKFPVKVIKSDKLSKPGATMEETVTITLSNIRLGQAISPATFAVPTGYQIKTIKAPPKPTRK